MSNLSLFPPSHLTFVILQMDIVPISSSQATTGPHAKSIRDNAARSPSWRVPLNRTTASPRPPTVSIRTLTSQSNEPVPEVKLKQGATTSLSPSLRTLSLKEGTSRVRNNMFDVNS
jgi:signal-transduction protein with cAMP-binding, CBS, and nucleotidyltransferase domain